MTVTKSKRHVHKSTISLIINIQSELSSFKAFLKTTIRQNLMLSKVSLDLNKNSQLPPQKLFTSSILKADHATEQKYVTLYAIWYYLYNLKNVKNTRG